MSVKLDLTPENTPMPLGASYFWDAPQLPPSLTYPMVETDDDESYPYTFIAQINCAEASKFDDKKLLPQTGFLYFFADIDYFLGFSDDTVHEDGIWNNGLSVLYADVPVESLVRTNAFDEEDTIVPHKIKFTAVKYAHAEGNKLLGVPYIEDVLQSFSEEWTLLFQLCSDSNAEFNLDFDGGSLFFMIEKEALINCDFSYIKGYLYFKTD